RIMLLSPILLAAAAVATSLLNAQGRFAASAVAPLVYNLAIIGAAIFLAPVLGVPGLALGVVIGALGHLLIQLRPLRATGFRYRPQVDLSDPDARQALVLMAPRALGLGASQVTFLVATSLASGLATGSVSAFTFAFTAFQIPLGVIGQPMGVVTLPSMSRDVARGDDRDPGAGVLRQPRYGHAGGGGDPGRADQRDVRDRRGHPAGIGAARYRPRHRARIVGGGPALGRRARPANGRIPAHGCDGG